MLEVYLERLQSRGQALFYGVALGGGTALLILSSWIWWHYSYLNPQTVFWSAIGNNLVLSGVTKHTTAKSGVNNVDRYDQIYLGANNLIKSQATVSQAEAAGQSTDVITETIGTPDMNFSRYTKIETGQKAADNKDFDFKPVLNQWGKQAVDDKTSGAFSEVLFGELVPIAGLPANSRGPIFKSLKNDQVYTIDFDKVGKRRQDGRLFYDYKVTVAADKYVNIIKQIDAASGLKKLTQLDASQYAGGAGIPLTISVDAHGHQIASIVYEADQRKVAFSAYGARPTQPLALPSNTISQTDLQAKLNAILGGR